MACGARAISTSILLYLWQMIWSPLPEMQSTPFFLAAAAQALRDRLDKPLEQFQAYFLALFSDKDYAKVLDSIANVDKALRVATPAATTSTWPHLLKPSIL